MEETITEEQFDEWYPNMKIRRDGSGFYIGIPETHNTAKRRKTKHEVITVTEQDGKLKLKEKPHWQDVLIEDDSLEPPPEWVIEAKPKESEPIIRTTTRKKVFEELYKKYLNLKPKERREKIYTDMVGLFKSAAACAEFVDINMERKKRNAILRRMRFARVADNEDFNYFVTFTYSDEKHTEESFRKKLLRTLSHFAERKDWKYAGVWERGDMTDRLHFHGLCTIPKGTLSGEWVKESVYDFKRHRRREITMNSFFLDRYGRNEFEEVEKGPLYNSAVGYIMKYMEKTDAKVVYSKGLYQFFVSDVMGEDILCKYNPDKEGDNRVLLMPGFTCWNEGVKVGEVSEEVIAQLPKSR